MRDYCVVLSTDYGPVIALRNDLNQTNALRTTGRAFDHSDIALLADLAWELPRNCLCLDLGANFGLFTLALAQSVAPLDGQVWAYEAQRLLAYMISGTVALNSLVNVRVHHLAMGSSHGLIPIPQYDYGEAGNFGSLELHPVWDDIGLPRLPDNPDEVVELTTLDALRLPRLDLIKIDVEGMEMDVLEGGFQTFKGFRPVTWVETLKSDKKRLMAFFQALNYEVQDRGSDLLCLPRRVS